MYSIVFVSMKFLFKLLEFISNICNWMDAYQKFVGNSLGVGQEFIGM